MNSARNRKRTGWSNGMRNAVALRLCALSLLALAPAPAMAKEIRELYRGTRAQAMGGAFTAVADDEQAIFYNPAGLAGQKRYGLNYMVLGLEASTGIYSMISEGASKFNNLSGDTLNEMMGKNNFAHAQFTPSVTMSSFGASLIVDEQVALRAENKALPQVTLGYQQTNGIQVAWGATLGGSRSRSDSQVRVGAAGKMLWRRGGYRLLSMTQLINVSQDTLKQIAGNYQRGYGFDLGLQFVRKVNNRLDLKIGSAWTDIGDTKFGDGPDPVLSSFSTGIAATYHFAAFSTTLAYDLRQLNHAMDWRMKSHLGLEVGLPLLRLYAGLNQAFLTYGVGFDAWLFKIMAVTYGQEQGAFVTQDQERRYLLEISLKVGI